MSRTAISVENLGKEYVIGGRENGGETFREMLVSAGMAPFRRLKRLGGNVVPEQRIWALKDVSFEVKEGEVVGIIGRNGAGKSTLLKILSRITAPTEGRVRLCGRVSSLLEVGTGFHTELTGRENIYLNGAILGMSRAEIDRKFDDIVDFSGVDRFLDTPVKRYSSGMSVRLAFAVAAQLEPEILIVDEVLAVGDAEFQTKCLGKMSEVAQGGRTVLFVSHNMAAINRLCGRAILLEDGRIKKDGEAWSVSAKYLVSDTGSMAAREWRDPRLRPGDDVARLIAARVTQNGRVSDTVDIRDPIEIEMTYEVFKDRANLLSGFSLFNAQGVLLFVSSDLNDVQWSQPRPPGIYVSSCCIPGNVFAEGIVRVVSEIATRHPTYKIHFLEYDSLGFQVVDTGQPGSVRGKWGRSIPGVMRIQCDWSTVRASETDQAFHESTIA
jgi:lipopolysaccharide transport system ATP-binding protein